MRRVEPQHETKLDKVLWQIASTTIAEQDARARKLKARKQSRKSRKINRRK